jgi:hypothetical protein
VSAQAGNGTRGEGKCREDLSDSDFFPGRKPRVAEKLNPEASWKVITGVIPPDLLDTLIRSYVRSFSLPPADRQRSELTRRMLYLWIVAIYDPFALALPSCTLFSRGELAVSRSSTSSICADSSPSIVNRTTPTRSYLPDSFAFYSHS